MTSPSLSPRSIPAPIVERFGSDVPRIDEVFIPGKGWHSPSRLWRKPRVRYLRKLRDMGATMVSLRHRWSTLYSIERLLDEAASESEDEDDALDLRAA